ncbi:COP9 signalosome complex subunit 2 [Phytophthora rubi]|uniref:COP9 signalosome complex subunit 2 n=1 Tax=Phytophthora rubi TaxID=129364 RepID=A0A6A3ME23_9STRA|nr:COP9 signalosome complex subunit 2 [Phytophthora rubi]KAE9028338.1 COP9 signalosome complex subunit 2 [Phytophthora rubi]KAE9330573.1 COP9 signalosome complex subunit 2 [Phytophthora rubi]
MSDSEEYEYEYDSDEQFDSDEQGSAVDAEDDEAAKQRTAAREAQIALENTFYEAEDFRQRGDLTQALEFFQRVVALEREATPLEERKWSFQALEHVVKICVSRRQWEEMLRHYEQMLEHLAFVTRNESTDSISSILDVVSGATGKEEEKDSAKYTSKMYELTLDKLKDVNNDRLWFSMNVKLGKLYLDMQEFDQLQKLLNQLYEYCQTPDGVQDHSKATSLLDVYALEIQLCVATKNSAKMRVIYPKTLDLDAAVADPRIMGVIREEGGKMYLEEKEWMLAYNEFFESFRNYQEAGNSRATQCLKYVVLANMLASSDINPFDSREAKVYQDVEEIGAMLLLRGAYETNDIVQFEKILKNPKYKLLSDPIMRRYLNPLLRNIRCQVMKKLVRPYQAIHIASLSKSMNITTEDVEDIAVALIQNLELDAKIDQSRGLLVLQTRQKARDASKMYDALDRWTRALSSTHATIAARVTAHQ